MDVLTLRGVLTLDKSEYDRGLETAEQGARSFGGRFSKAAKVGTAAAAALGVAAGYAGKKIVDGAKQVAAYGDNVDKMSQKIGISSDAYQKWDYVMQRAGGNVDQLKMGMKTLSQQAEKNSDAFQKLGISQEEVQSLNQEELFARTIKGLSDMEAGTERTALASQLLGRAGADMGPLLNQGSAAIEEQMEIAEKYGMIMPESTVKASAAFEDSMTTMQMTAQGLKNRLLGEFLPAMTQVTDGMAKLFTGDMSGIDDVVAGIEGFIGKIGEMAPKVFEAGGKLVMELVKGLIKRLPDLVKTAGQLIGKLLEGLTNTMNGAGGTIAEIIQAIVKFVTENAPMMIQAALSLALALAQGLVQAIPTIIASIPKIISGIVKTIKGFKWAAVGKTVMSLLANGVRAAVSLLKSAVTKPISAVKTAISSGFSAAKQAAVDYMTKLKDGVKEKIEAAKDAVKKVVDKIKSFFPFKVGKIFSNLKVPKISVSGGKAPFGIGGLGTKPSIKVSWNKKAEQNPYLFTNATLFGAGEGVNDEMLYGKKSLMNDITEAMRKGADNTQNNGNIIINLNYTAGDDANDMVRDLARGVRRYRMAGAF